MQFSTYDSDAIFRIYCVAIARKMQPVLSGCSIRMTGPERKNISFGTTGKFRPSGGSMSHLHRAYKLHNQPLLLNNFFGEDGGKLHWTKYSVSTLYTWVWVLGKVLFWGLSRHVPVWKETMLTAEKVNFNDI